MTDDERYAAGFAAGFAAGKESGSDSALRELVERLSERLAAVEQHLQQIDRPRMTAREAPQTFNVLKRTDPSLTLQSFAMQHNLSYDTLRQARSRQSKKRT